MNAPQWGHSWTVPWASGINVLVLPQRSQVGGRSQGVPAKIELMPGHKPLPFTCVLTLFIAAIPVLVLGIYQPQALHDLLDLAAAQLAPMTPP